MISLGIPYLYRTLIAFELQLKFRLPGVSYTPWTAVAHLGYLAVTGYYQLYYLEAIMELYVFFPFLA